MDNGTSTEKVLATKEAVTAPLQQLVEQTEQFLPQLQNLSDSDKQAVLKSTKAVAEGVEGQEAFVPANCLDSLASFARHPKALQGFLNATAEKAPSLQERTAATLRWEPMDQFTEAMRRVEAGLQDAGKEELAKQAEAIVANATKVQAGISGRELDAAFIHLAHPSSAESPSTAAEPIKKSEEIASPLTRLLSAGSALTKELESLPAEDKQQLAQLTPAYKQQSTLPETNIPDDIVSSLPDKLKTLEPLQGGLAKLANPVKTGELTVEETSALEKPREQINDARVSARALGALLNALNTPENEAAFNAGNLSSPGKYDKLLALTSQVTSAAWEAQKGLETEQSIAALKQEADDFKAKPLAAPSTVVSEATGTPVMSHEQQHGHSPS